MHRIKRIDAWSFGKIMGIGYGAMGLLLMPVFLLFAAASPQRATNGAPSFLVAFAILAPFLYGGFGFFFGVISAGVYNLIARWVGGIELDLEVVPAEAP